MKKKEWAKFRHKGFGKEFETVPVTYFGPQGLVDECCAYLHHKANLLLIAIEHLCVVLLLRK